MIGYSFATGPNGLQLAGYGKCCPSWSVSVFNCTTTATGFTAVTNHGFKVEQLVGTLSEDGASMNVVEDKRFTDSSGRGAKHHEGIFERVNGDLSIWKRT